MIWRIIEANITKQAGMKSVNHGGFKSSPNTVWTTGNAGRRNRKKAAAKEMIFAKVLKIQRRTRWFWNDVFSLTTSWSAWIPWMLVSQTCCMRRLRKMHLRKVPFGPLVCNSWVVWSCGLRTYSNNIRYMQHKPQRNINCSDLRPDSGHSQVDYSHDLFLRKAVRALRCVTISNNYQEWCIAQSRQTTFCQPCLIPKSLWSDLGW